MKREKLRVAIYLILGFGASAAIYYFSPIDWALRAPRNYQECFIAGGKAPISAPANPNDKEWTSFCVWEGHIFSQTNKLIPQ